MKKTEEKYVGTCLKGLEDFCCSETNGRKIAECRVEFANPEKYKCLDRIYKLKGKFNFKDIDELVEKVEINGKFTVLCSRTGKHEFNSAEAAKRIAHKFKLGWTEEKKFVIDIIGNECFYGELIYDCLCKRDYRVKLNTDSANACIAYAMLKMLGACEGATVLDPFCRDGVILIEAARLGAKCFGFSRNVRNARINAKVAGVKINLEENDITWMRTRFKENEVLICSYLYSSSKSKNEKMIFKFYRDFFENAFVAKKICVLCRKRDLLKFADGFKLEKEIELFKGNETYFIFYFERAMRAEALS